MYPLRRRDVHEPNPSYASAVAVVERHFGQILFAAHAPALRQGPPNHGLGPTTSSGGGYAGGAAAHSRRLERGDWVFGPWAASEAAAADAALAVDRLVVLDGAFSPAMFAALRRLCVETTAFFDSKV